VITGTGDGSFDDDAEVSGEGSAPAAAGLCCCAHARLNKCTWELAPTLFRSGCCDMRIVSRACSSAVLPRNYAKSL
jgi:hypothetical protein